jgi:hypothetical protein
MIHYFIFQNYSPPHPQSQYLTRLTLRLTTLSSPYPPLESRISTSLMRRRDTLLALCVLRRGSSIYSIALGWLRLIARVNTSPHPKKK